MLLLPTILILLSYSSRCVGLVDSVDVFVARGSTKVPLYVAGPPQGHAALSAIDLAGQKGECESAQVVVSAESDLVGLTATMSPLVARKNVQESSAAISAAAWGIFQQGYVNCTATPNYSPSGGGWHPDPLLHIPQEGIALVPAGLAQPIFLTLCLPRDQQSGTYAGQLALAGSLSRNASFTTSINITVEVWPATIPTLREGVFEGTWTFGSPNFTRFYPDPAPHKHTDLSWYPANTSFDPIHNHTSGVCCSPVQREWYKFFEQHRTAADPYGGLPLGPGSVSPTGSGPSLIEETSLNQYKLSNRSGSRYMFINDVTYCPGNCEANGGSRCPQSYTEDFVEQQLAAVEPYVSALRAADLMQWSYVYGGDECPSANRSGQMQMFRAVKKKWPDLRTKTSLQYAPDSIDLPVDTWAQTYMEFYCEDGNWDARHNHHAQNCSSTEANRRKRDAWLSAGKKYWWYWACQPTDPWLNPSFIEFPAIHARLFFWLMALENVTGVHYWAVDTWGGDNSVMGVEQIDGTMLTTFDVRNRAELVNGDGLLIYPPQSPKQGPLSSIRLENIRDGIEDFELFHAVGVDRCEDIAVPNRNQHVAKNRPGINMKTNIIMCRDLIEAAILNGTHFTTDVEKLESLRREAATRLR